MEIKKYNFELICVTTLLFFAVVTGCKKNESFVTSPITMKKNVRLTKLLINFQVAVKATDTSLRLIRVEILQDNIVIRRSENIRYRISYNFGDPGFRNFLLLNKPITFENVDDLPDKDTTLIVRTYYTNTSSRKTDTTRLIVYANDLKKFTFEEFNKPVSFVSERY